LEQHLQTCAKNAMYISPKIQNEIIGIVADMIKTQILCNVIEQKKFYSIIADSTTDVSGTEQLSLSVRYLSCDNDQITIKEDFIGFTPVVDNSAKGLSEQIITYIQSTGLDLTYLRGKF
jgi:hypothetical protein